MTLEDKPRPRLRTDDTLDQARFLKGSLLSDGITKVELLDRENGKLNGNAPDIKTADLQAAPVSGSSETEEEDYDEQELDQSALAEGYDGEELLVKTQKEAEINPLLSRRPSISVKLEKTDHRGRYLLTADDPEIRDLLRRVLDKDKHSSGRSKLQDLVFTQRFTAFDRSSLSSDHSPFFGFFTLFWLAMGLLFVRVAAKNWRTYGSIFGNTELLEMMFNREVFVMALTDGAMVGSTIISFFLQRITAGGYLEWSRSGWILQNVWQAFWLVSIISWTFYREWPWTHTIFIVLHAFCFLMKQHSYAFYNGYLSQVLRRKESLEKKYRQLDAMSPVSSPVELSTASNPFSSGTAPDGNDKETLRRRNQRDHSLQRVSTQGRIADGVPNLAEDTSEIASIASAISSGESLTAAQMDLFKDVISTELKALETELKGKCVLTHNHYPTNVNLSNFAEWCVLPTLVYELEYPRQDHINWSYIAEKAGATFGTLAVMQVISQAYIYPLVMDTVRMKEAGMSLQDRWHEFPWVILDLLFPMLLEQLLSWYVIWECVLNVVAELTRFADRGFYGAWWNSVSFADYARDWNKPVHNFLLRHVYHSSISAFRLSKTTAMIATFLLSACVHELLMFCLFKKVRGYLFAMQLLQLPLAALSRTKLLKEQRVIGNVFFWFGIFVGPSILTSLYLII